MKKLVIVGCGGLGREVAWIAMDCRQSGADWDLIGFLDDDEDRHTEHHLGLPVLGQLSWLEHNLSEALYVICGVGNTRTRKTLVERVSKMGGRFATLVHPSTHSSPRVSISEGCVVAPGCVLSTDVKLGCHVYLNLNCTVGHDARLDDFVVCGPSCDVSGAAHLKMGVQTGAGAQVGPGVTVGEWARVGARTALLTDLGPDTTVLSRDFRKIPNLDRPSE